MQTGVPDVNKLCPENKDKFWKTCNSLDFSLSFSKILQVLYCEVNVLIVSICSKNIQSQSENFQNSLMSCIVMWLMYISGTSPVKFGSCICRGYYPIASLKMLSLAKELCIVLEKFLN